MQSSIIFCSLNFFRYYFLGSRVLREHWPVLFILTQDLITWVISKSTRGLTPQTRPSHVTSVENPSTRTENFWSTKLATQGKNLTAVPRVVRDRTQLLWFNNEKCLDSSFLNQGFITDCRQVFHWFGGSAASHSLTHRRETLHLQRLWEEFHPLRHAKEAQHSALQGCTSRQPPRKHLWSVAELGGCSLILQICHPR